MKKLMTLLTVLLTLSLVGQAQTNTGKISGKVIDGSTKTIEAATITLHKAKDSSVVKISVANKEGDFVFEFVKEGSYFVSITAVGHNKGFSETVSITTASTAITLKTIELIPVTKSLGNVTVTARKPLIEQKIDRTIVNVEASVTNVGASALEVLEKSPGITVDKDGNVSLKGKQGVQIFIDGRPSYLSGPDLANYLRNLQSQQLDQIEIMTNPPAKYDAAGNAGIINIKTKKNKQFGYNGSLTLGYGQGRLPKFNEGFNFNYRHNKINLFTNLSHNYRKNFQELSIQRKFIDVTTKNVVSHFNQVNHLTDFNQSYSGKIGMDYNVSKKTTMGVVVSGFINPGEFTSRGIMFISDPNMILQSETRARAANKEKWKNVSTNFNMRHIIDSLGKEISGDIDYIRYRVSNNQQITNSYYNAVGVPNKISDSLIGNLPQHIDIYSAKVDYIHPLKKGAKLEMGFKTSYVETDNDARYDSLLNRVYVLDSGRYNHFTYKENVNAAYVNYSKQFSKKWSGQFGLRVENTNIKGHSTGYTYNAGSNFGNFDSTFKRNYTQLFPTVYMQYAPNEKHNFGINYGRRIRRPDYESLNPFIMFLDRYTFEQGNPNLLPQFSHNVELTHTFKGFLTTTLNYTKTTDIIQQILVQNNEKNQTFVKQANIASQRQYGIAVNIMVQPKKWWNGNIYMNVYNNNFKGIINNDFVSVGATTGLINISNQFKFNKGWAAEAGGFYRTEGVDGIFRVKGLGMVSMGVSKTILKQKGSLRFSVRDVFWTNRVKGESRYSNIDASFQQYRDSRVANLSFTYRFAKGKMNGGPKRKAGGAGEEQSRVKNGGDN
ncbi:MAG: hypothetical protein RLZZ316_752 [Bacteroidota bacterium]